MKWKLLLVMFCSLCIFSSAIAQQATVSGKITSAEDDSSVPGVSILLKGTSIGTVTDSDGNYKLSIPSSDGILTISFIGFETQEIEIAGRSTINVVLIPDVKQLGEVVVTALGVSREQSSLGYSVQSIGGDAIKEAGTSNVIDALRGQVAGVQINNSGGQAGGGTSMVIRGFSSINYSNQPLFIVDGIPINNDVQFHSKSGTPSANRAIDINPNDIESISVLKGGAATALYGIRAANGAVVITTKKGAKGTGLNVEYNIEVSREQVNKLHETTNVYSRGRFGGFSGVTHWNYGPAYSTGVTFPAGTSLDLNGDGVNEDVGGQSVPQFNDNYERFWQDGSTIKHNIALSGGGENNSFYVAVSRQDQEGIIPNQDYDKSSFLLNATQKIHDKVSVSAKANYINTGGKRFRTATGILEGLGYWHHMWDINNYPWKRESDGYKTWFSGGVPHPQWIVNEEGEDWRLNRLIGSVNVTYDMADWLSMDFRAGIDTYDEERTEIRPYGSVNTASNLGDMTEIRLTNRDVSADLIFRGQRDINDNFDINYLVGGSVFRSKYDRLSTTGTTFVLRDFFDISNTVEQSVGKFDNDYLLLGLYGDISIGYNDMLYLGITGRNDWSSTLPESQNNFFYPSVSLGFVLSEVFQPGWLSFAKLRASYASTSNDAPTQSLKDVFVKQDPNIFGNPRFTISNDRNNPNIKPEKTTEYEIGFDARFFDNLIGLDLAYYNRTSSEQIIEAPTSAATGYSSRLVNLGEVENKGIEAILTITNPVKIADFNWTTNFNFTKNEGTVKTIGQSTDDDLDRIILVTGWWSAAQIIAVEGEPYGTLYGYANDRYNVDESDPNYLDAPIVVDADGQPSRSESRVVLGNVNPDWTLGMTSNLTYKGVKFGFTLERRQGGDVVNGFLANLIYSGTAKVSENRWYADDDASANYRENLGGVFADGSPNTAAAAFSNQYWHTYRRIDENLIEDGSWWRLRNIYIGYALPQKILEATPFKSFELTFSARNAWLKTDYTGNDPELSAHGAGNFIGFDELVVPNNKSFALGARMTF
ncbi:SusC/RagA family TonB-linked outer membrane protein [Fulvivirgaceae bacterium BMA10]|uniref:SusC/RagA family TonB-linked outer membrane protein n=1 Tax=Splendidivirga corallicola TaxID=3051826 RepID=A0ABT8KK46_9BACT|nr:SusC/RagA family TonB-linked outer membrane protein [Fulvivirgaceae bacterium BMA10]